MAGGAVRTGRSPEAVFPGVSGTRTKLLDEAVRSRMMRAWGVWRGWPTPTGWVPKAQEALPQTFQGQGRILLHLRAQVEASCSLRGSTELAEVSPAPRCAWGGPPRAGWKPAIQQAALAVRVILRYERIAA